MHCMAATEHDEGAESGGVSTRLGCQAWPEATRIWERNLKQSLPLNLQKDATLPTPSCQTRAAGSTALVHHMAAITGAKSLHRSADGDQASPLAGAG